MEEVQNRKLCDYLNEILPVLEFDDSFFLDNLINLIGINDSFVDFLSHYDFSYVALENKLTFNDVYLIARDFVSFVCPKYLPLYDELINSGELDFSFEGKYGGAYFRHVNPDVNIINVDREFCYNDVITLIHEFIHYTNGYDGSSINRYVLAEFLSIFFELLCIKYLIDNGANKEEIGYCDRLRDTYRSCLNMNYYELVLASYRNFGCLDYDMTYTYIAKTSKDSFEEEAIGLLNKFESIERIEKQSINSGYALNVDKYSDMFHDDYRYIFGTLLAFYAYEYCDIDRIIYLNDHINDDDYADRDLIEVLESIGISFDNDFLASALGSIEDYMKAFSIGLKR